MKRLLAWDSSTEDALIVLAECSDSLEFTRVLGFKKEHCQAKQSERLLEMIHEVVTEAGLKLQDIDCLGVGEGPGSFTGIRIGFTTTVTLARVIGKPVVTVSSMALALRESIPDSLPSDTLFGFYRKACLGEGYVLLGSPQEIERFFSFHAKSERVFEGVLLEKEIDGVIAETMKQENSKTLWMGGRYASSAMKNSDPAYSAETLARLVLQAWRVGGAKNPLEISPIYLRESDAERKLKQGLLKPSPIA